MRTHDGPLAGRTVWCTALGLAAVVMVTPHASANPAPVLAPPGRLWSWGIFGNVLFDLIFDLAILAAAGWLIGPFRRRLDARFFWWGGAIWVGGLAADAIAWSLRADSRLAMVATAALLIFVWNLILAAALARVPWWRDLALAAMIAVLTAPYLMPKYRPPQRGARACISNLRQIAIAARMYTDDWEGALPDVGSYDRGFSGNWTPGRPWGDAIRDYVKAGEEIFKCPKVGDEPSPSYAWNRHLSGFPEKLVRYPTTCPVAWDFVPGAETAPGIPLDPPPDADKRGAETRWAFYPTVAGVSKTDMARACSRHSNGLILAFVDGHARFERPRTWSRGEGGRFMACDDIAMPWPPEEAWGFVISMYPSDPMAAAE